ncbi:hypothetical protein K440DRAFT_120902 [Wilcoxina mikolae CBS 423.85]|nr:hypothetical protein K440DRAFT_120902 [Wilcoxina mikolae CBS 423.85]
MSTPQPQSASQLATVASTGTATPPLIPPHTIRIKRARDEAPVTALYVPTSSTKRIKTSDVDDSALNPSYVFRLAHTLPPGVSFQPKPADDDSIPLPTPLDTPPPSRKRKIAPVRKYQLSKRARTRHPHPYSPRAGAVFELVKDEDMRDSSPEPVERQAEASKERKKPRTHPKEKAALQAAREQGGDRLTLGYEDDEKLMKEMEKMVLEYLGDDLNDGIKNLPPTAVTSKDRIGGGVGGGTWAEKDKDIAMADEDEDGFVYDVYFREEVPAGKKHGEGEEESYGVIVFAESEDEAWWYEGADEEEDLSDVYASDDEDSNAEDYHTNDYPDEPVLAEDEEDEYGHGIHDYSDDDNDDDDIDDDDSDNDGIWKPWKPRRTVPGEEEYDLEDESEDEEPAMRRMVREVWSIN